MIDIENLIITKVDNVIFDNHNIHVTNKYPETSAEFPCVTILEQDNYVYQKTQDNTNNENHARLMYEIQVFTNDTENKKGRAKSIASTIDSVMSDLGFTRAFMQQIPNIDRSIYRIVMRYRGVVSKPVMDNGNTTFTIYKQ